VGFPNHISINSELCNDVCPDSALALNGDATRICAIQLPTSGSADIFQKNVVQHIK
jgi:hypothetical protein